MAAVAPLPCVANAEGAEPIEGNYFIAVYPPFSEWTPQGAAALLPALEGESSAKTPLGLYVHLPFCQHKCDYCYFLSYINQPLAVVDHYLDTLLKEIQLYAAHRAVKDHPVRFVYFGGGTPSVLTPDQIRRLGEGLRAVLPWEDVEEVTYECAPRSVRPELLSALADIGVTRVSMGVQSFDDVVLKLNGRIHLAEDTHRAYELIREAKFTTTNLDLMVGMIGERSEKWRSTIQETLELEPDSVTIYQTEIPYNTQLYRDLQAFTLPSRPVNWQTKRIRLLQAFETLERAGYTVVSAYNAVRNPEQDRCRYQQHLWQGANLLGLGVASFGYFDGVHYQNETNLEHYQSRIEGGMLPLTRGYELSHEDQLTREFILQLKLGCVERKPFIKRFGADPVEFFGEPLVMLEKQELLHCTEQGVELTRTGLARVDRLLPLFYAREHRTVRYT